MKGAVALDANLLLLLVVGSTSSAYIQKHKRLQHVFTEDDLALLTLVLEEYSDIVLLPNTLTETSNLLSHIGEPARSAIFGKMRQLLQSGAETFMPSAKAAARHEFLTLGLTDAALLELAAGAQARSPVTLLTVDLDLAISAESSGYTVINFNHVRDM